MGLTLRPTVRVILLNENEEILLVGLTSPRVGHYWIPPGGGVEEGEDSLLCAIRELAEETGISNVPLHDTDFGRDREVPLKGVLHLFVEKYFVGHTSPQTVFGQASPIAYEVDHGIKMRWWSREEIKNSAEQIFPHDLVEVLDTILPLSQQL